MIIGQYLTQLQGLTSPPAVARSIAPNSGPNAFNPTLTTPNQVMIPSQSWDWDPVTIGYVSDDQFLLSDLMPLSNKPNTLYSPSAKSFSTNYRTFLEFIDARRFPAPSLLSKSKADIAEPTGCPSAGNTPDGWTKVNIAGIDRFKPIWNVPIESSKWKLDVDNGVISNAGTIFINLKNSDDVSEAASIITLVENTTGHAPLEPIDEGREFEQVEINAKAWAQIPIAPGSWFNSSIISLGKPYLREESMNSFFGPNGLLSCRVSAFYVAAQPKFTFYSTSPVKAAIDAISDTKELQVFGMKATVVKRSSNEKSVELEVQSNNPSIVAVALENFS